MNLLESLMRGSSLNMTYAVRADGSIIVGSLVSSSSV
jgi:hypothetical protein